MVAWIKTPPDAKAGGRILNKRPKEGRGGFEFVAPRFDGQISFYANGHHYNFGETEETRVDDNQWHFIAVTYDNGKKIVKAYRDGEIVGAKYFGPITPSNADLYVGAGFFNGKVDGFFHPKGHATNIRAYNSIINRHDLAAIQNATDPRKPPPPPPGPGTGAQNGGFLGQDLPNNSTPTSDATNILFINNMTENVTGYWLTFDGTERGMFDLVPGANISMGTYVQHVWLIRAARVVSGGDNRKIAKCMGQAEDSQCVITVVPSTPSPPPPPAVVTSQVFMEGGSYKSEVRWRLVCGDREIVSEN